MRFSLRTVFIIVAVAALGCFIVVWFRDQYYVQLRTVDSVLAEYPQIDAVWLCTNDDVTLEVEKVYFSTVDDPGLTFGIDGIDGAGKSEIRHRLNDALREKRPVTIPNYAAQYRTTRAFV